MEDGYFIVIVGGSGILAHHDAHPAVAARVQGFVAEGVDVGCQHEVPLDFLINEVFPFPYEAECIPRAADSVGKARLPAQHDVPARGDTALGRDGEHQGVHGMVPVVEDACPHFVFSVEEHQRGGERSAFRGRDELAAVVVFHLVDPSRRQDRFQHAFKALAGHVQPGFRDVGPFGAASGWNSELPPGAGCRTASPPMPR